MNKVEIKNFLGSEVRIINNEYMVLKDMFEALGRVKEDGTWTDEKNKMDKFLDGINQKEYHETLVVLVKQGRAKVEKEIECLKLEVVPVVLTQFKPTNRKGKEAIDKWFEFMKFVNELLVSAKAHKFIIEDTELEKIDRDRLHKLGGSPMKMATMVNYAMGIIITGEKIKIGKDDLKSYQNQITIDLLECRRYFINEFINAYKILKSHSKANKYALQFVMEHYGLNKDAA